MSRRRAKGHKQDRITTQQQVDALHRDNGRVIPWWTILVVILQVLSLGTILVLTSWNTDLKTQFNRSETRAANLASDLSATRLGLGVKLQELDVCQAAKVRLRTNLTVCDRDLLRNVSLAKTLNTTLYLLGERSAQGLNKRDAALLVCNTRCDDLEDRLEEARRELGDAEHKKAEEEESEKESPHSTMFRTVVKTVVVYTAKRVISAAAKEALGEDTGTVVNLLLGV